MGKKKRKESQKDLYAKETKENVKEREMMPVPDAISLFLSFVVVGSDWLYVYILHVEEKRPRGRGWRRMLASLRSAGAIFCPRSGANFCPADSSFFFFLLIPSSLRSLSFFELLLSVLFLLFISLDASNRVYLCRRGRETLFLSDARVN